MGGGAAVAGATLDYTVTVQNVGAVPAQYVVITDDLDVPNPGYLNYVAQSATMNGLTNGITFAGSLLTADYSTDYGPLQPGETIVLRFQAVIEPNLAAGTPITNVARATWNDPPQWSEARITIQVGAVPGLGMLTGTAWHDSRFRQHAGFHRAFAGRLDRNAACATVIRFVPRRPMPAASSRWPRCHPIISAARNIRWYSARRGRVGEPLCSAWPTRHSPTVCSASMKSSSQAGGIVENLNLPIDPDGVIYDSIARLPISNAVVSLVDARSGVPVPRRCFDDRDQQDQATLADGYYKFDINFSDPACPSGADYAIRVVPPDATYIAGASEFIPPTSDESTPPFNVPSCPGSVERCDPCNQSVL